MDLLKHVLTVEPELALLAALFFGYLLGRIKFKDFSLGGVAGSLIVGLVIGQLGVTLPDSLKALCFALFIYSVGYKSGPEFFGGLNKSSLKLVVSASVQCLVALITALVFAHIFRFEKGYAAGLAAGAYTATAMMGTAGSEITRLDLPPEESARMISQMAVGFAITYVFGTIGTIVFVRNVAPKLLGVDMKKRARELEEQLSEGGPVMRPGQVTPFQPVVARAFKVTRAEAVDRTVRDLEKQFYRASVEQILRHNVTAQITPETKLRDGDIVGLSGLIKSVKEAGELIGTEVESPEALSFPQEIASVVITSPRIVGKTLAQIREHIGMENLAGVYLVTIKRAGISLPTLPDQEVRRGDVFELAGRPGEVRRVAAILGKAEPAGGQSDLAYHALGMVIGTLIGLLSIKVGGVPLTLGVGGGVLVAGLCFGWLHARYPVFGALPQPAQWILSEFGLSAFAAVIGLAAGPKAIAAIKQEGVILLFTGAVATLIPLIVALYLGRFLLKLHPVILLGALAGGQSVAASLNAATEAADSMTPTLGFTITYAISNVLLAVWGPLIIAFAG